MAGDSACNSTFFVRPRRGSRVVMVPLIWLGESGQKLPSGGVTSVFPSSAAVVAECYLTKASFIFSNIILF